MGCNASQDLAGPCSLGRAEGLPALSPAVQKQITASPASDGGEAPQDGGAAPTPHEAIEQWVGEVAARSRASSLASAGTRSRAGSAVAAEAAMSAAEAACSPEEAIELWVSAVKTTSPEAACKRPARPRAATWAEAGRRRADSVASQLPAIRRRTLSAAGEVSSSPSSLCSTAASSGFGASAPGSRSASSASSPASAEVDQVARA